MQIVLFINIEDLYWEYAYARRPARYLFIIYKLLYNAMYTYHFKTCNQTRKRSRRFLISMFSHIKLTVCMYNLFNTERFVVFIIQ
jgi:hypothetical protein